jgi:hypothetical protein
MKKLEDLPEEEFNEKRDSVRKLTIGIAGIIGACISNSEAISLALIISSYIYARKNVKNAVEYVGWYYNKGKQKESE